LLCDEAHHIITEKNMKIPRSNIKYKYYFTATMRKEKYHDMDNEKIFGKVLYKLNMKEAIE